MATLTGTLQVIADPANITATDQYLLIATEDGADDVLIPLSAINTGGGGNDVLDAELTALLSGDIGGVSNGETFPVGTSIETVLRELLTQVTRPNYTLPTCEIIHNSSGTVQVGINEQKTIKVEAGTASINFTLRFILNDAGDLTQVSWQDFAGNLGDTLTNGGGGWPWATNDPQVDVPITYTKAYFDRGTHSLLVGFQYDGVPYNSATGDPASDQDLREKLNNQGVIDVENVFGAGNLNPFEFIIEAVYKVFARKGGGADNTQTITNWTTDNYPLWEDEGPFEVPISDTNPMAVVEWAVPNSMVVSQVENYNPFTNAWSTVPHTNVGSVSYTLPDSTVVTYNIIRADPSTAFTAPVRLVTS